MFFAPVAGADNYTPADSLADREEFDATASERTWVVEREVFRRLCVHWFSGGPSPEEVLQRVFAAALARRPDLLTGFTRRETALAVEDSARGLRWRLIALFDGVGLDWRKRYLQTVSTLRVAFEDAGRPELSRLTLSEALGATAAGGEPAEAAETLSRVLETIFRAGNSPRAIAQQTFALTGWLFRDLQLNMPFEALGSLFSETRATQSARSKVYVEGLLKGSGCRGFKAGWQKPAAACDSFSRAAQGNQNRRRTRRFHCVKPNQANAPTNQATVRGN